MLTHSSLTLSVLLFTWLTFSLMYALHTLCVCVSVWGRVRVCVSVCGRLCVYVCVRLSAGLSACVQLNTL